MQNEIAFLNVASEFGGLAHSHKCYTHWRRSALNSAGALVQGGDGEFRGIFIPYYKFSGIV